MVVHAVHIERITERPGDPHPLRYRYLGDNAVCRTCGWESPMYGSAELAIGARDKHIGDTRPAPPPPAT